jgi:cytoskeleton protein RodZ
MESNTHNKTNDMVEPSTAMLPPGAKLAAARIARGMSIEDVAKLLKLSPAKISAIEADDHSQLPSAVFVRGFIRSYARLLNVDIAPMLPAKAAEATFEAERMMHRQPGVTLERQGFRHGPALLTGFLLLVAGLAYFEFVMNAPPARPQVATSAETVVTLPGATGAGDRKDAERPTAANPVVREPAESTGLVDNLTLKKSIDPTSGADEKGLHFVFNGESWVEVRGKDGRVVFSMINAPGSERIVRGDPPFSVVIGSASGVQLSYNGNRVNLASYVTEDVARLRLE